MIGKYVLGTEIGNIYDRCRYLNIDVANTAMRLDFHSLDRKAIANDLGVEILLRKLSTFDINNRSRW